MALYRLDARGPHYDDLRAGTIASMLANINRDTKARKDPFAPLHFITWNEFHQGDSDKPILLDDPEEQSKLMLTMMFPKKNG